jgi:hypothetical protein
VREILKIMTPEDQPRLCGAHPHARHSRVTIRVHEVNVSGDKDVLIIRAAACENQRAENYDFDDSEACANHITIPNPGSPIGNPKLQVEIVSAFFKLDVERWTLDVRASSCGGPVA